MDHESLRYLMKSRYTRKKMMAWAMELQEYDIGEIIHVPGEKNCIADCLSRLPLEKFLEENHEATLTDVKGTKKPGDPVIGVVNVLSTT